MESAAPPAGKRSAQRAEGERSPQDASAQPASEARSEAQPSGGPQREGERSSTVDARVRRALAAQRAAGRLLAPVWMPAVAAVLRLGMGYRVAERRELRRRYRRLHRGTSAPLLVCANHLTLIDSAILAWALGSPAWYLAHWDAFPWNVPERENFAASPATRALTWAMKCIPIARGGDRHAIGDVLARLAILLQRGESVLLFPEGGRSRTSRVDVSARTYGVGRLLAAVPGCRVLCVYLRGERQRAWSRVPAWGERFHAEMEIFEPRSEARGLRRSVELTGQVLRRLAELEKRHFARCGEPTASAAEAPPPGPPAHGEAHGGQ